MYDIIGDVHGHATLLKRLLNKMGYVKNHTGYVHHERKAVFVGDFTNRGPEIRKTLQIIRQMVDTGYAYAVLGNHEVNNILYQLKNSDKEPLLNQKGKRYLSVTQTLQEFSLFPDEWKELLRWMRTLPFFLELDGIRIVHAYWSDVNIGILREQLPAGKIRRKVFRNLVQQPDSPLSKAILQSTRGVHLVLPPDLRILDNRRRSHRFFRVKWWLSPEGMTFHDWSFESKFHLPHYTIPPQIYPGFEVYQDDARPVFFGHYCRGNGPFVIGDNICCVDSCVSSRKTLVAYRWSGESRLDPANIVMVSQDIP